MAKHLMFENSAIHHNESGNGYYMEDPAYNVVIRVHDLHSNGRGPIGNVDIDYIEPEITILGEFELLLASYEARTRLSRQLTESYPNVPWAELINEFCQEVIRENRRPPEIENINEEPERVDIEYLFATQDGKYLVPVGHPTTFFTQGGSGKSLICCDYLPLLLTYGAADFFIALQEGKALVLDWEADAETHRRYIRAIKNDLQGKLYSNLDERLIHYQRLDRPLPDVADYFREYIKDNAIDLVIIDSQMASMSGAYPNLNDAQISGIYYNILNSFNTTTITIDHVSKSSMNTVYSTSGTAYGSVVKYNRARAQWELKQTQEPGDNFIELAFTHTKFNLGPKLKPFGMRIDFTNDDNGLLQSVRFSDLDLSESAALSKVLPLWQRIRDYILWESTGTASTKELAEHFEKSPNHVNTELGRHKELFVEVGGGKDGKEWGILQQQNSYNNSLQHNTP